MIRFSRDTITAQNAGGGHAQPNYLNLVRRFLFLLLIFSGCAMQGKDALPPGFEEIEEAAPHNDAALVSLIKKSAHPVSGAARDYDPLMSAIGGAGFVLLGEATHGTHEFYRERATISRRLVEEKGFAAVVLEADWSDAYRVNEYVQGRSKDRTAEQSLSGFRAFPNGCGAIPIFAISPPRFARLILPRKRARRASVFTEWTFMVSPSRWRQSLNTSAASIRKPPGQPRKGTPV
jgi:hypothetical protein